MFNGSMIYLSNKEKQTMKYQTQVSINKKKYQVENSQKFTSPVLAQNFADMQKFLLNQTYSNVKTRVIEVKQ